MHVKNVSNKTPVYTHREQLFEHDLSFHTAWFGVSPVRLTSV